MTGVQSGIRYGIRHGIRSSIRTGGRLLGAAAAGLLIAGCSLEVVQPCDVGNLTITAPSTSIAVGQVVAFSAEYLYRNCSTPPSPEWSSSNTAVARVASDGKVTGVAVGTAVIRADVYNRNSAVNVTGTAAQSGVAHAP